MKTIDRIKVIFWVSLTLTLIFVMYIKQVYLAKNVLVDYVGTQAIMASWALSIISELLRGSFAYASFLASEKNFTQTKTISILLSLGITGFDFWEIYHYLDVQSIAYTAYFLVSITMALELLGGMILSEIQEVQAYETYAEETIVETVEEENKIHSPFVKNNYNELLQEKEVIKYSKDAINHSLLSKTRRYRKSETRNRSFQSSMALTLF